MFWLDGDEIIGEDPWETPTAPLAPTAEPPRGGGTGECDIHNNTAFHDADIANAPAVSAMECCKLCQV
jgi:hypothetical protein